ncbi:hypothetical protein GCM10009801_16630 [Streptomyces albiaxialis]|uniref:Uncharacterized protein n=1 Tax=Streptomyces albiaxialis TaxID=329523 RepID=A0ABP5H864_9ACTN
MVTGGFRLRVWPAFAQPGAYRLRAVYQAPDGSRIVSPPRPLRVRYPLSAADEQAGELLMGDQQGTLLVLLGSDSTHLRAGNDALEYLWPESEIPITAGDGGEVAHGVGQLDEQSHVFFRSRTGRQSQSDGGYATRVTSRSAAYRVMQVPGENGRRHNTEFTTPATGDAKVSGSSTWRRAAPFSSASESNSTAPCSPPTSLSGRRQRPAARRSIGFAAWEPAGRGRPAVAPSRNCWAHHSTDTAQGPGGQDAQAPARLSSMPGGEDFRPTSYRQGVSVGRST